MIFILKKTNLGIIQLDGDAFKSIISKRLSKEIYLQELSFSSDGSLMTAFIAVPDTVSAQTKKNVEIKLSKLFVNSGITFACNWLLVASPQYKKKSNILNMPVTWAAVGFALCALIHIGIKGLLWSFLSGVCAYAIAWLVLTDSGHKHINEIWKNITKK